MLRSLGVEAPVLVADKPVVLVLEENAVFRSITVGHLTAAGFEVLEAANSAEAEQILKSIAVDKGDKAQRQKDGHNGDCRGRVQLQRIGHQSPDQ